MLEEAAAGWSEGGGDGLNLGGSASAGAGAGSSGGGVVVLPEKTGLVRVASRGRSFTSMLP